MMCRALVQDPYVDLDTVPMMPKKAKAILDENYVRLTSRCKSFKQSADGETTKLLIELQDGLKVEAVVMTYDTSKRDTSGQTGGKRHTLCVSSEVGCQMGCTFCATGVCVSVCVYTMCLMILLRGMYLICR